jgi:hypothetical protein
MLYLYIKRFSIFGTEFLVCKALFLDLYTTFGTGDALAQEGDTSLMSLAYIVTSTNKRICVSVFVSFLGARTVAFCVNRRRMAETTGTGNANARHQSARRVRFRERGKSISRTDDAITADELQGEQNTICHGVPGRYDSGSRRLSLPSIHCSLPRDGNVLPCPVRLPGMVSSSSVQPTTPNFNATLQSVVAVRTRRLSSRDQGRVQQRQSRRASSTSRRRGASQRRYTVASSEQAVSSLLPRYSQLSGHPNDDDCGNSLDRLHSVQLSRPPRYSTGTIPEEPQNREDFFHDLHSDDDPMSEMSTGIQATSILFLFVCTVHLVMGIILCVIAARTNSSTPKEMSTSAYTWPGILVGLSRI